ncbi:long-chain-fatty-acid--CoA ligase 4-like isoform X2 [Ornithodoros turicata]|uniref:long-chain-fatty-acid--CoA ligase 4-like isoform X2 n=1 Tax=Ornithodoros turicata TaxID=34597 RepID=UPI003139D0A1
MGSKSARRSSFSRRMSHIGISVAMGLIKALVTTCDVITFPFYFIFQRPWDYWRKKSLVFAQPTRPNDPGSPHVRTTGPGTAALDKIKTMAELTQAAVHLFGDKPCFGTREILGEEEEKQKDGKVFKKLILGGYKWLSYREVDQKIDLIGKGLMALGVRPRQNLVILAETRVEWMLAAQACLRINIPVVTLYATLGEEGIIHGINETEATHLITSYDLLPKISKILNKIPSLTHIIYMESPVAKGPVKGPEGVQTLPFSKLEESGKTADAELRGEVPTGDDIAIIMYTSGSTGVPKGVMITHENIVTTARGFSVICRNIGSEDAYIAYLPLAHVLELAAECLSFALGAKIGYSSPLTLTDKSTGVKRGCQGDASLLKPTIMVSVPLILDRIRKSIAELAAARGAFFNAFFEYLISYKSFWLRAGFDTPLLNRLVFKKMQALLGGHVRVIATGSAPLSADTHEFIQACLGCYVVQGYGLTETAAGATVMDLDDVSFGRVGPPISGCYIRLVDWDEANYHVTDKPYPRGEILIGGPCVTKGYYKNEALTNECYLTEGGIRWFYTGDIGELYPDGTVKIIDRKKDLVKLQFGEYVSLGKIETELKTCPIIDNLCVYGSSYHTYLIALVAPNHKQIQMLATQAGKEKLSFKELCEDPEIIKAAVEMISTHGRKAHLQKVEIPLKVRLCPEDWQPDTGLVTAAYKIRRRNIQQFYQHQIDEMYEPSSAASKST